MTMKLVFMINLILLVGVSAFSSTALGLTPPTQKNPAHRKMVVSQHSQPPRRRRSTSLAALVGNAYLNQLEQQTIEAAGTTETGSDYAVAQQVDQGMEENIPEVKKLMKQIKEAGTAGIISFALVQLGFWSLSLAIALFGYVKMTGHFPDLTDKEELSELGAEAFAYVNIARFAAPLRIAFALSSTSWIQTNVLDRFNPPKDNDDKETA